MPSLAEVAAAIAASWGPETWYARVDDPPIDDAHPSRNQCGTTALVLQDWLGGELLVADVTRDGQPAGVHYWNRLADGTEVDLTRDQFVPGESVGPPAVVVRPPGPLAHGAEPYGELARRVALVLSSAEDAGALSSAEDTRGAGS